jgi:hypothetical protein
MSYLQKTLRCVEDALTSSLRRHSLQFVQQLLRIELRAAWLLTFLLRRCWTLDCYSGTTWDSVSPSCSLSTLTKYGQIQSWTPVCACKDTGGNVRRQNEATAGQHVEAVLRVTQARGFVCMLIVPRRAVTISRVSRRKLLVTRRWLDLLPVVLGLITQLLFGFLNGKKTVIRSLCGIVLYTREARLNELLVWHSHAGVVVRDQILMVSFHARLEA